MSFNCSYCKINFEALYPVLNEDIEEEFGLCPDCKSSLDIHEGFNPEYIEKPIILPEEKQGPTYWQQYDKHHAEMERIQDEALDNYFTHGRRAYFDTFKKYDYVKTLY